MPVPQLSPNEAIEEPAWRPSGQPEGPREPIFLSPVYQTLETNIPKELMRFSDKPFPPDAQLFPKHETVLKYLKEYAEEVMDFIQFETQVLDIRPSEANSSAWSVTSRSLINGTQRTDNYDAVVVATGHYNVPYVPDIHGIAAWDKRYPGIISHSKFFDTPEAFRDKKVVVVGNSASGLDIGAQISTVCKGKLLASQRSESFFGSSQSARKRDCPEIVAFLPPGEFDRGVRFADGTTEEEIDAIVFCTGYFYAYPFLSSVEPPVVTDGTRARNVYQQLFYIDNPTLVFPVLPQRIIPFPMSENQAAVFARVWSGRLRLPSRAEMKAWEDRTLADKGEGRKFHLMPFPMDADYLNFLYNWAAQAEIRQGLANDGMGKVGTRWGERERWWRRLFPEIRRAFMEKGEQRSEIKSLSQLGFDFEQRQPSN